MTFNLTPEQIALIRDMIHGSLRKADDKMKDRLFELKYELDKSPGKVVYYHLTQPASFDELATLAEYRDKGWGLVSHSFYTSADGELRISFIFARYCDGKNCHNCKFK